MMVLIAERWPSFRLKQLRNVAGAAAYDQLVTAGRTAHSAPAATVIQSDELIMR
jgi:hypothetical protein